MTQQKKTRRRKLVPLLAVTLMILISFGLIEVVYRVYLKMTNAPRVSISRLDDVLKQSWFKPHPYLVYTFKPNNSFTFVHPKYNEPTFTTNQFGFRSTCEHDVQTVAKPPDTLRISTFGGSTTMGTNSDKEVWPYLTGKKLEQRVPDKKVEVLNEGLMGYTSLDNLIDLAIRVIDFDCDVYVLYFGVNDYTAAAPLDVYKSDHSHYRKTLHESIGYSVAEIIPRWLTKSQAITAALHAMGMANRQSLAECTGTGIFREQSDFKGFEDDEINTVITRDIIRNVTSMVGIIRARNPNAIIVLSSFYDQRKRGYVKHLNPAFEAFAKEHNVVFVDIAGQLPYDRRITFDDVHFMPEGAELVSDLFADAIAKAWTALK